MHSLTSEELIDRENHAWSEILDILGSSRNTYKILPAKQELAEDTLVRLQVSTKSYLGSIAFETGGIIWDNGWLILLGSGCPEVFGSLSSWNGLKNSLLEPLDGLLLVAYDAAGGFFALDTGKFGRSGHIYYFAPDCLEWESTDLKYSEFVEWLAQGDLELFYQTFRWEGWREEMKRLAEGQVFAYYPPLWSAEGGGETSQKNPIDVREAWSFALQQ